MSKRVSNPLCDGCNLIVDRRCTAQSFTQCKLATIQSACAQFAELVFKQAGQLPYHKLLVGVLCQAVNDSLHMHKPSGMFSPKEALTFVQSDYARACCVDAELDAEWFIDTATRFIETIKASGLKSIGAGRRVKRTPKKETRG